MLTAGNGRVFVAASTQARRKSHRMAKDAVTAAIAAHSVRTCPNEQTLGRGFGDAEHARGCVPQRHPRGLASNRHARRPDCWSVRAFAFVRPESTIAVDLRWSLVGTARFTASQQEGCMRRRLTMALWATAVI